MYNSFNFLTINHLFIYIILLCNIILVLPYINMNPPWVYTCSPSWTPLPPSSPYHPSESSQCTSPKHPASCIEPGLSIHFLYDTVHVSMLFSQIIPPSPTALNLQKNWAQYRSCFSFIHISPTNSIMHWYDIFDTINYCHIIFKVNFITGFIIKTFENK